MTADLRRKAAGGPLVATTAKPIDDGGAAAGVLRLAAAEDLSAGTEGATWMRITPAPSGPRAALAHQSLPSNSSRSPWAISYPATPLQLSRAIPPVLARYTSPRAASAGGSVVVGSIAPR
jgi:hypothetical protein